MGTMNKRVILFVTAFAMALLVLIQPTHKAFGAGTAGKADITLEAEKGVLTGLETMKDTAASGGVYVQGFDNTTDKLKVTADIKTAGTYIILIKYKTIGGNKINPLYLNGNKIMSYTFKDTASFQEVAIGQYKLGAGKNTFEIGMSWGWIAVDYIRMVGGDGKKVNKVTLSVSSTKSLACDMPVTLTALADDAAQYRFLVRKSGGDWKEISAYTSSYSCIWVPKEAGKYELKVYARGLSTTVDKQAEAWINYQAQEAYVDKPLVNQMFGSGMVLQRDAANVIYGWDKPNSSIIIQIGNKEFTGTTDAGGKWSVDIGTHKAGGPYVITIKGSSQTVKLTDVLFGDVWLCSGQSNMAFTLSNTMNALTERGASNYPDIRYIKLPDTTSAVPLTTMGSSAVWKTCSVLTSGDMSAVAYFFARKLNQDLKVPIGVIISAVGGTKAECWTSYEGLQSMPAYKDTSYAVSTGSKDIDIVTSPVALYNGMIAPITPFKLKGVLWYQGESNWGEAAYYELLPALIADWRAQFNNKELPFILIQIPAFGTVQTEANPVQTYPGLPEIREAQLNTMLKDVNVGLVTIADLGDPANIHPTNKQDVGARAAICAEGKFYGKDMVESGPIYQSMSIEGNKIILTFDNIGSGLMIGSKNGLDAVKEVKKGKLTGFAIAGVNGVFYSAEAVIKDNQVIVSSDQVTKPTAVRYGWYDSPVINLYNKEGLIASPFRTDNKN